MQSEATALCTGCDTLIASVYHSCIAQLWHRGKDLFLQVCIYLTSKLKQSHFAVWSQTHREGEETPDQYICSKALLITVVIRESWKPQACFAAGCSLWIRVKPSCLVHSRKKEFCEGAGAQRSWGKRCDICWVIRRMDVSWKWARFGAILCMDPRP